jgi:hypothetical protein
VNVAIASPVYTLGGWQGNVRDDYQVDWVVEEEEGWSSSPPARPTQEDKSVGDGAWAGPGFYGPRVVTLTGKAVANSQLDMLAAKDRLKSAVGPRRLTRLQVDELHLSRVAMVRLTDQIALTDIGPLAFSWSMILTAPDPRRYAAAADTVSTGLPTTAGTGRTYPRTYPRTYGGAIAGGAGSVSVTQAGDYDETPAVVTFWGPVTSPSVTHVQTGRSLVFDLTLADGEYLVVDLLVQTALLAGTSSRMYTLTGGSGWFLLVPGTNELQFRGQAGATTLATATATATSGTTDYLPTTDADAADINIGDTVQLYNQSGVLKEAGYLQVTSKPSTGGTTSIYFSPAAAAVTVAGDYLQRATPDFPRMTVTASSAWT